MSYPSALLGFGNSPHEKSKEEEDNKERNTKKYKEGDQAATDFPPLPTKGADGEKEEGVRSFKEIMVGADTKDDDMRDFASEEEVVVEDDEGEGIRVEEHEIGRYKCPAFI
ncbi:hypothetical protein A2U01_0060770, partial [Trifolium medium]|nr:hypothetical protein [Trifolium medium]